MGSHSLWLYHKNIVLWTCYLWLVIGDKLTITCMLLFEVMIELGILYSTFLYSLEMRSFRSTSKKQPPRFSHPEFFLAIVTDCNIQNNFDAFFSVVKNTDRILDGQVIVMHHWKLQCSSERPQFWYFKKLIPFCSMLVSKI